MFANSQKYRFRVAKTWFVAERRAVFTNPEL
jgi:hypothetical protein